MRTLIILLMAVINIMTSAHAETPSSGSNLTGTEKVCSMGLETQTETGLVEALKKCQRGDILLLGWLSTSTGMQLCDFSKVIIFHEKNNSIAGCVYTGFRRPVSK